MRKALLALEGVAQIVREQGFAGLLLLCFDTKNHMNKL